jgi:hypothetical protein
MSPPLHFLATTERLLAQTANSRHCRDAVKVREHRPFSERPVEHASILRATESHHSPTPCQHGFPRRGPVPTPVQNCVKVKRNCFTSSTVLSPTLSGYSRCADPDVSYAKRGIRVCWGHSHPPCFARIQEQSHLCERLCQKIRHRVQRLLIKPQSIPRRLQNTYMADNRLLAAPHPPSQAGAVGRGLATPTAPRRWTRGSGTPFIARPWRYCFLASSCMALRVGMMYALKTEGRAER